MVRRAFVGFSSPIGYDYKNQATKTESDIDQSPNPILYGPTGIFVLYDEVWFPCRSVCPENMRQLDFVKFLDTDYHIKDIYTNIPEDLLELLASGFDGAGELILDGMFPEGYAEGILRCSPEISECRGITGLIKFSSHEPVGQPSSYNLLNDIYMIERAADLDLSLVFNPLTVSLYLSEPTEFALAKGRTSLRSIEVATEAITLGKFRNLISTTGPYHFVYEDLRNNRTLKSFREWMDGHVTPWDNREITDVVAEVNSEINKFNEQLLKPYERNAVFYDTFVHEVQEFILGAVPFASSVHKALSFSKKRNEMSGERWKAFCVSARNSLSSTD